MADDIEDEVQGIVDQANALYESGTVSQDDYHKCLVVAAQRSCSGDDVTTAMALMHRLPRTYYKVVLPQQVLVDPLFGKLVAFIAEKLLEAGFASFHEDLGFVQTPGVA